MDERRGAARVMLNSLRNIAWLREKSIQAQGLDVSSGGLLIQSSEALTTGQRLSIEADIILDGFPDLKLKTNALVVHANQRGKDWIAGLRFIDPPKEVEHELELRCNARAS